MKRDSSPRPAGTFRVAYGIISLIAFVACIVGIREFRQWRIDETEKERGRVLVKRQALNRAEEEMIDETRATLRRKRGSAAPTSPTNTVETTNEQGLVETGSETNEVEGEMGKPASRLTAKARSARGTNDSEWLRVLEIRKKILATSKERNEADMKVFSPTIPRTNVKYVMVPIKSGEFVMGSLDSEPQHQTDEGPQHTVSLSPFWMGQCEVTWNEYELFMYRATNRISASDVADAVAMPTKPYIEMSFGMGKDGFPAISMTQHAANKYCQWLSARLGHFYRLPTEAEWEYACRAGTTNAYSFGDEPGMLSEYGWFLDNSDEQYHKVRGKKPNAWGLYDMHGNVAEWCLDQYESDYYELLGRAVKDPWNKATEPYPHVVRGGSWEHPAAMARSAARFASHPNWKQQDPQLPKSIWYMTDAKFLGFRIVRPLKIPSAQEMYNYWNSGVEREVAAK